MLVLNGQTLDSASWTYGKAFVLNAADGLVAGVNTLTVAMTSSNEAVDGVRVIFQQPDVIAAGTRITGAGTIGDNPWGHGQAAINNQGSIDATIAGQTLTIDPSGFTNDGLITAQSGAGLAISPNLGQTWQAEWTTTRIARPSVSTRACSLRPFSVLPASSPTGLP